MVLGIVPCIPIAYFAGGIGQWLQTKHKIAHKIRSVTGSIFIMLGLRVAFLKRSHCLDQSAQHTVQLTPTVGL